MIEADAARREQLARARVTSKEDALGGAREVNGLLVEFRPHVGQARTAGDGAGQAE